MAIKAARAASRGGVAACAVAVVLAAAASAGSAAAKKGFAPGSWSGRGIQSGTLELAGNASPVSGAVTFQLRVAKNLKASGTVHIQSTLTTERQGLRGRVMVVATLPISGTASNVTYAGNVGLTGTLTDGRVTVPFKLSVPTIGKLVIGRATCARAAGTTDARIPFTWRAARTGGSACR